MNKIYKFRKALATAVFFSLIISSCTEEINLPLDNTYARLVVDGSITTDTTAHKVVLSKSGDALNKDTKVYISNAVVTISDGTKTYNLSESPLEKGVYMTDSSVFGLPNMTYTLNIFNVDINSDGIFETYTASSLLKKTSPIDSITIKRMEYSSNEKGWAICLYGYDAGGGRNYYLVKSIKNKILLTDSIKEYGVANNAGFEGKYYPGIEVAYMSSNNPTEIVKDGDTLTLELDGITEDYSNYIGGFQMEYRPKTPLFSGPSANVTTNIEPKNSAVGFFAAYSVQRSSAIYKEIPTR